MQFWIFLYHCWEYCRGNSDSGKYIHIYIYIYIYFPSLEFNIFNSIEFQAKCKFSENSKVQKAELVTLNGRRSSNTVSSSDEVIKLPVPYELPPQPYSSEGYFAVLLFLFNKLRLSDTLFCFLADVPWSWDRRYNKKDVYGQVWPRHVQLYSNQDS